MLPSTRRITVSLRRRKVQKMINLKLLSSTAVLAVGIAGSAWAQDLGSSSFAGGVSLLSPEQTGFSFGGTAEVTGLGSAAVVVSSQAANFNMTGFSNSGATSPVVIGTTAPLEASANSGVLAAFDFDRTVTASASGIGAGRVVAQGDAKAAVGAVGSAFGDTVANQIADRFFALGGDSTLVGEESSTSNATSESAASLIGEGSTSVLAGLIGTTNGFVGSTGTTVSSEQGGIAYSALNAIGDAAGTGIAIAPTTDDNTFALLSTAISALADGKGTVGFSNAFTLESPIDLAVANVGGGTISLGASTGGFFGGGAASSGQSGFGSILSAAETVVD
jgi:hypothetical protein